jgi:hypothetical protein
MNMEIETTYKGVEKVLRDVSHFAKKQEAKIMGLELDLSEAYVKIQVLEAQLADLGLDLSIQGDANGEGSEEEDGKEGGEEAS